MRIAYLTTVMGSTSGYSYLDQSGWTNFDWVGEIEMRSFKGLALAFCIIGAGTTVLVYDAYAASIAGVTVSGPAILLAFGLCLIAIAIFRLIAIAIFRRH